MSVYRQEMTDRLGFGIHLETHTFGPMKGITEMTTGGTTREFHDDDAVKLAVLLLLAAGEDDLAHKISQEVHA